MKRSKRVRNRDRDYAAARVDAYEAAGGRCRARVSRACSRQCEEIHHVAGRNVENPHALANLLAVCHACHRWIHENPAAARERGLMRSRLARTQQGAGHE